MEDQKKKEDEASGSNSQALGSVLDPMVMVPFIVKSCDMTRDVAVERLKRYYSLQNITELLKKEGIDCDNLMVCGEKGELPLNLFDDVTFETRLPSQWVDKVTPVPAQAAFTRSNSTTEWKPVTVTDYLEESNTYFVQWSDTGQTTWLPRILVFFQAEDPFRFLQRFVHAVKARATQKVKLRYKLYVESMPVEDIPTLTDEQIKRIKEIVYNSKAMRERNEDVSKLLGEANMDYAHMMNKLVFDESLKRQSSPTQEFTVDLVDLLPVDNSRPPVPQYVPCNLNEICLQYIKVLGLQIFQ